MNMKSMNLIELKSVGSWLDTIRGVIYPSDVNGFADFGCATSLIEDEVSSEWYDALSASEYRVVLEHTNMAIVNQWINK